ncbi:hypothetical protein Bbelb_149250 [Branchiostoma belcheri]|nr:hypothetical protein Bbelb_149250 [Branchiostoma belcheri]
MSVDRRSYFVHLQSDQSKPQQALDSLRLKAVNQLCHIHSATTTGSSCISLPTPARTPTYSRLLHGLHVANLVTWDSLPKANYVGDLGATSGPRGAVGMTHQCVDTLCHPPSLVPAMG